MGICKRFLGRLFNASKPAAQNTSQSSPPTSEADWDSQMQQVLTAIASERTASRLVKRLNAIGYVFEDKHPLGGAYYVSGNDRLHVLPNPANSVAQVFLRPGNGREVLLVRDGEVLQNDLASLKAEINRPFGNSAASPRNIAVGDVVLGGKRREFARQNHARVYETEDVSDALSALFEDIIPALDGKDPEAGNRFAYGEKLFGHSVNAYETAETFKKALMAATVDVRAADRHGRWTASLHDSGIVDLIVDSGGRLFLCARLCKSAGRIYAYIPDGGT